MDKFNEHGNMAASTQYNKHAPDPMGPGITVELGPFFHAGCELQVTP